MDKKYQFGDVEVEVPEFNFKKVLPVFILSIFLFLAYNSVKSFVAGLFNEFKAHNSDKFLGNTCSNILWIALVSN